MFQIDNQMVILGKMRIKSVFVIVGIVFLCSALNSQAIFSRVPDEEDHVFTRDDLVGDWECVSSFSLRAAIPDEKESTVDILTLFQRDRDIILSGSTEYDTSFYTFWDNSIVSKYKSRSEKPLNPIQKLNPDMPLISQTWVWGLNGPVAKDSESIHYLLSVGTAEKMSGPRKLYFADRNKFYLVTATYYTNFGAHKFKDNNDVILPDHIFYTIQCYVRLKD
jgi:hypothetical protein